MICILSSSFFVCVNLIGFKYLFEEHSGLGPIQLLLFRAIIAVGCNIISLNTSLKYELYDRVLAEEMVLPVAILVLLCVPNQVILYSAVSYWPTTTCQAVMLSAPLLTLIMAWMYLGEVASRSEFSFLMMTLVGAAIIIMNPSKDDERVSHVA